MDINSALSQVRPILSLVGSLFMAAALAKFFGLNVPYDMTSLVVAGFAAKQI